MALLSIAPANARVGDLLTVLGVDFANTTECTISCPQLGNSGEVVSDGTGQVSGSALADHAKQTLTSTGVALDTETVTIGGRVYTFKTTLTAAGVANEVLIGANASASLDNLKAAINGAAGAGSTYGKGTVPHADVVAGAKTATTLVVIAKVEGTAGNSIVSTETLTNFAWGAGTLAGGAAAGARAFRLQPTKEGTYLIRCTDGTTTVDSSIQVWASA